MAIHEIESVPVLEAAAGIGVVNVSIASAYAEGVVPVHKYPSADKGVVRVATVAVGANITEILYNIFHSLSDTTAYRYWRLLIESATQQFYVRGLQFDGQAQAGFPYTSADPPTDPDFVAVDRGSALGVTKAKLFMHNIEVGAIIKLQGGPVPPQAGVTTDGTGWIDVPIAGLGTLVGVTSDWAFGISFKTGADVTTAQYLSADYSSGTALNSFYFYITAGTISFLLFDGVSSYGVSFVIAANTTYRMLGSFLYSDKKLRLYKDGVLQGTTAALAANMRAGVDFTFLRPGAVNAAYITSGYIIGNAIIYGEYLDADEALAEFNGTFTPGAALKGEWLMDEGSGTTVDDSSPENNNGTLTAGASWSNALAMVDETLQ